MVVMYVEHRAVQDMFVMVMDYVNIVVIPTGSLWGTIGMAHKNVIQNVVAIARVINIRMVPTIV
jgi:phosphosulfolactate synthase (CoM biosynthesis protein A)